MKVKYYHERPGEYTGNIIWHGHGLTCGPHRMRNGKFPSSHPCSPGTFEGEMGHGGGIEEFRKRGYWASCFPEGDGITMKCEGEIKPCAQVVKDIEECFGWEVEVVRGDQP